MDEPRNANPTQRGVLSPNPLSPPYTGPPLYPHQPSNTDSECAELATVVDFIRKLPGRNKPMDFIGWSAAAPSMGPYTLQHPEMVKSLFLLAPVFPPDGRWSGDPADPLAIPPNTPLPVSDPPTLYGFPMFVSDKKGFVEAWNREQGNPPQREPGMEDTAWAAMMANDPIGSKWGQKLPSGAYEGIQRFRNPYFWGWTKETVPYQDALGNYILGDRPRSPAAALLRAGPLQGHRRAREADVRAGGCGTLRGLGAPRQDRARHRVPVAPQQAQGVGPRAAATTRTRRVS
ncbi:hypothetical protein [Streptomyces sp. NPDC001507]|uniref:hypothetical protein n=1 Tax=Streptomyces sp. NPDC001507 TaxID=3364579 RepID=UPI0036CB2673